MLARLARLILRIFGWKISGSPDRSVKKSIYISAPHSSNWDFPLGVLARTSLNLKISFLGKKSLFKPPWGWIFTALGGYPVDRSKRSNTVDQIVTLYNDLDEFHIVIAPEGTRKKVDRFKTGFYFIAIKANIPIHMSKFDYQKKTIVFREPFYPSGDIEKDMNQIYDWYRGTVGKNEILKLPVFQVNE